MYLTNDVEIKTAQLKGKDDMLNGIYYYHPSVESIQKYANLLRKDLELSPINDKNDFLDQRVINHYGSLIPLTPLDNSLLRKNKMIRQIKIRHLTRTVIQLITVIPAINNNLLQIKTQIKIKVAHNKRHKLQITKMVL